MKNIAHIPSDTLLAGFAGVVLISIALLLSGCELLGGTPAPGYSPVEWDSVTASDDSTGSDDAAQDDADQDDGYDGPGGFGESCDGIPFMERIVLDIWGRPLPTAAGVLEPTPAIDSFLDLTYSAVDHLETRVTGEMVHGDLVDLQVTGTARYTMSRDMRPLPGWDGLCDVRTLYIGLDHAWFSAAAPRPPRDGNQVELMIGGEELFTELHADLQSAEHNVNWATWWWESDFELIRPDGHHLMSKDERAPNTIMSILESRPQVETRLNISQWCGDTCFGLLDWVNTDDAVIAKAEGSGDNFEVVLQANETGVPLLSDYEYEPITFDFTERVATQYVFAGRDFGAYGSDDAGRDVPAASYHQKMLTIDGEVAYVGGMNVRHVDWDTDEHQVFEEKRMLFDAEVEDRIEVYNMEALADHGPRRDYSIRVEGPVVADVDNILRQRWAQTMMDEEPYAEGNTMWAPAATAMPLPGGVTAQFTTTMPDPLPERSVLESMSKAIAQADNYIYIEDQYWRAPVLNEVILETLLARPWVKLIVVTKQVPLYDGGAWWTAETDQLFRDEVPDQYLTLQARAFDWQVDGDEIEVHDIGVDVHSKMLIVDDRFMSVGSANKNNRGMLFEGEANVAVLDDAWVKARRIEIFSHMLGPDFTPSMGYGTFDEYTWLLLQDAAEWNDEVVAWWADNEDMSPAQASAHEAAGTWPSGLLHSLELPSYGVVPFGPDAW